MEADIKLACAVAEALTKGKTPEELSRLHVFLQVVASLVAAEINCLRTSASNGGARQ